MKFLSVVTCCTLSFALSACCTTDECTEGSDASCCADGGSIYGAAVSASTPLTLVQLLDDSALHDGQTVVVQGEVVEVCQSKGCWMVLADGDRTVRIKFLDYAYFVPKDLAGSTIVAEGVFSVQLVPMDEAKHYLEDAGRLGEAAAITEDQPGFELMAAGVIVL